MNSRKIAVLASLFIIALVFSCRNESELNPDEKPISKEQNSTGMPRISRTSKFEKYLQEKFNDTLQIQWEPNWSQGTYQKVNDTISYSFVELVPSLINTRKKSKILKSKTSYKKYLIFTSKKTGEGPTYIAKYFPRDNKKGIDMKSFSGKMLLHNLDEDTWSMSELNNGVKKKGHNDKSARTSTICFFTECTWYSENCLGVFISATFGEVNCPYPTSENCYGEIWYKNSETTFTLDCGDDPTGPGGPGGNGGLWEFNQFYHIPAPVNQISNLGNRLSCFKNWRTVQPGHTYKNKLTLYIDQPVNGTDQLFRTDQVGYRQAGHVYMGIEQTDTYNGTSTTTRLVLGFYPYQEKWAVTGSTIAGTWGEDGGSPYDYSLTVQMQDDHFDSLLDNLIDNRDATYNLQTMNCVTMAWWLSNDAFSVLGGVPSGEQQIGPFGLGKTPAKIGQEIVEKFGNSPNFQNSNGSNSPQSQNCN